MVTDYVTICLMAVKMMYGFRYLKSVLFLGSMDEKYIMDKEGTAKWQLRNLTTQRKHMQDYYMITIGFQRFSFIQSIALILIFFDKLMISLKIIMVLVYSVVTYFYLIKKMKQLIKEMNHTVSQEILRNSQSSVKEFYVSNKAPDADQRIVVQEVGDDIHNLVDRPEDNPFVNSNEAEMLKVNKYPESSSHYSDARTQAMSIGQGGRNFHLNLGSITRNETIHETNEEHKFLSSQYMERVGEESDEGNRSFEVEND